MLIAKEHITTSLTRAQTQITQWDGREFLKWTKRLSFLSHHVPSVVFYSQIMESRAMLELKLEKLKSPSTQKEETANKIFEIIIDVKEASFYLCSIFRWTEFHSNFRRQHWPSGYFVDGFFLCRQNASSVKTVLKNTHDCALNHILVFSFFITFR